MLKLIGGFLGKAGTIQWKFQSLDNLIADRRLEEAKALLGDIKIKAPESYEAWLGGGLIYRAQGQLQLALEAFQKARELRPQYFRVNLEIFKSLKDLKMDQSVQDAFQKTQSYITNVRELMTFKQELNRN